MRIFKSRMVEGCDQRRISNFILRYRSTSFRADDGWWSHERHTPNDAGHDGECPAPWSRTKTSTGTTIEGRAIANTLLRTVSQSTWAWDAHR